MRKPRLQFVGIPILLFLSLFAASVRGENPLDPTVHRLSRVELFAIGGIGYAGTISEGERDYRAILREPGGQALKSFNELYELGNMQAKSFALLGIKKLDPARFKVLYDSLPDVKTPVKIGEGCILSDRDLRDIAKDIDVRKFPYDK